VNVEVSRAIPSSILCDELLIALAPSSYRRSDAVDVEFIMCRQSQGIFASFAYQDERILVVANSVRFVQAHGARLPRFRRTLATTSCSGRDLFPPRSARRRIGFRWVDARAFLPVRGDGFRWSRRAGEHRSASPSEQSEPALIEVPAGG